MTETRRIHNSAGAVAHARLITLRVEKVSHQVASMASLDDFFAKKDKRKKGKSKQNFVTSELLAKTIEVEFGSCFRIILCISNHLQYFL